jgi:chromosome segregation ATPase
MCIFEYFFNFIECNIIIYYILKFSSKTFTSFIPNYKNNSQINNNQIITKKNKSLNKNENNKNLQNNYEIQINELKRQLNEEKNKNQKLMEENNNLKKKIEKYEITIKSLKDEINKKNIEIEQYKLDKQSDDYITSIKPGEKIMSINFVSMGRQDIMNYSLVCKNTDLFVRLEERLYNDFPQFKNYETYFEVNTKRIKRFKTLEENYIKNKNIINMFIIDN